MDPTSDCVQESTGLAGTTRVPSTSTMDSGLICVAYFTMPCSILCHAFVGRLTMDLILRQLCEPSVALTGALIETAAGEAVSPC